MKILLKHLNGKIACKTQDPRVRLEDGQYPRIGWIHERGFRITKTTYQFIKINESPHYQFVLGNKQPYLEYMNTMGWKSGRKDAQQRFEQLIDNFSDYDPGIKYIEVVQEGNGYTIVDGLHRCSLLYSRDPEQELEVKLIKCPDFTRLPMKS